MLPGDLCHPWGAGKPPALSCSQEPQPSRRHRPRVKYAAPAGSALWSPLCLSPGRLPSDLRCPVKCSELATKPWRDPEEVVLGLSEPNTPEEQQKHFSSQLQRHSLKVAESCLYLYFVSLVTSLCPQIFFPASLWLNSSALRTPVTLNFSYTDNLPSNSGTSDR